MSKTGNKNAGENSALYNKLTNQNDIEFAPLKKVEGTNTAGYFPDGFPASEQHAQELKDPIPNISVNDNGSSNITDWKETPTAQKNGFGQKLYTALFGQQAQSTDNVNEDNPLFTALTKQQDEWRKQGLSEDAITGAGQGLNSGNKDIAKFIDDNNIRKPQTNEEIALAKEGKFNTYAPSITVSQTPPRGGFLRDLDAGMRENYNNEFSIDNLGNNLTPDGRKKGFAYRLGEGLGTLTRGMAGTTGDAWISGAVSPEAGLKRQTTRAADQLYRNALKDEGIDTENIKGFIDKDTYNSLNQGSARYMNAITRQQATESMNKLRALQVEKQKIINSTLPALEKAKLIKANAEAQHAEEYMLAKINALNNSGYLGMLNYGLNALRTNVAVARDARQAAKEAEEKRILEGLLGGGNNTGIVRIKAPDGNIYHVPESKVNDAINAGGVRI